MEGGTMLVSLIIMLLVGLVSIWIGLLIWKKEKISLIHSYHYTKVKESDKKAYTAMMGKGITVMGIGCISCGASNYIMNNAGGWVLFGISFFYAFMLITKAQNKYNGGFF